MAGKLIMTKKLEIQDYYHDRLMNCSNPYQGDYPRVLTICSAGLLRSATIAFVLTREPYDCNTRNCGTDTSCALIRLDAVLYAWADFIIYANETNKVVGEEIFGKNSEKKVYCFDLPDKYAYRDIELVKIVKEKIVSSGFLADLDKFKE